MDLNEMLCAESYMTQANSGKQFKICHWSTCGDAAHCFYTML